MNRILFGSACGRWARVGAVLVAVGLLPGCSDAQAGSLLGAGIGALAGQAIGGDTKATLIGAGVGAAGGYMIGNESDKSKAARREDNRY